jgi:DNA-binding protein HU-beta
MNKKQLAAKLAKTSGLTQAKALEVLNTLFDSETGLIPSELDAGQKVTIPGFGTFATRVRAERIGTDPATHKRITIKSKNYPYFRPGKTLKERMAAKK